MNKKFSTLLAGAALLVGAVSANAQGDAYADLLTKLAKSTTVEKLKADDNGLYQLSNKADGSSLADSVLYMEKDGLLKLIPTPQKSDSLANTLWCVKIVASSNQGQSFAYDFYNKGTGMRLDVTMDGSIAGAAAGTAVTGTTDSVRVGGEIAGWAFSGNYATKLSQDNYLFSYFTKDSVVGLAVRGASTAADKGGVFLVKDLADAALRQTNPEFKKFTLRKAAELVLTANEINTIFGQQDADKGVALSFAPDVTVKDMKNPFADKDAKFIAEQVDPSLVGDSANYVYVINPDSSYLRVDTALINQNGVKFLAYGWTKLDAASRKIATNTTAKDSLNKSDLKAQHQFLFTYKPSVDSVNIYVHRATFQTPTGKTWTAVGDTTHYANAHVSIQDLVKGQDIRIITVDSVAQNTHIKFNYAGCAEATNDKYSVANGLYIIKNKKGQVLAAPIHKNGASRAAIEWVTLDAQNPEHMPAFQWVVGKTQTAASLAETSPIRFINREFDSLEDTLQLRKKDDKVIASGVLFNGLDMDEFTFTQITDSTIIKDTVLGYRYIAPVDLQATKYQFNYMNPYTKSMYIGMSNDKKDSVLYVKENVGAFTLEKGNYDTYGVNPTTIKYVPGLAQLHRMQYVIVMNNDTLVGNEKAQYTVGNVGAAAIDSFYFKANNFYNEKDYYAIIQASKSGVNKIEDDAEKAGVADDGESAALKVQKLEETRTSSFTVEPLSTPLYRRFDSEKLEGNAGDASDTLRFVETYRGEVLQIEGNPSFKVPGVDMLGIYTAEKAPSGLSFVVDTAWVTRGLGYIKPQYLISIDRHDFDGVKGKECTESGPHFDINGDPTDAAHCIHATPAIPGFERGQYLVNFADSAAAYANENQNIYKWKGYDRVGFVEAIRLADTLYILRNEFKGLANDKIDFAAIKAADKAATDKGGISYIHRLDNDKHKYVTWSMRFTDPEKAANEVETDRTFLVESMKDQTRYANTANGDIAPEYASWLKNQNGCLVMSNYDSKFNDLQTGGDDALVFNVKYVTDDPIATDNEAISTSAIKVVGENGFVTISGAQGKNVVISTVLGQTIANTVISSDKVNFNAPAGVVVVAIEGEAAVKAIVE